MMEKLIVNGKTKKLYDIGNGLYKLFFKDDMTGENGVFDPGANTIGLTVEGAGMAGLGISVYFFELLQKKGFATHFVSANLADSTMTVHRSLIFGKGLEVICRYKAMGSYIRRYSSLITEGTELPGVVEMTIKHDDGGDPLITQESLEVLGVLKEGDYNQLVTLTKSISSAIKSDLAKKGLELCDIKLEFGRNANTGEIILIDELSAGNMRVQENGKPVSPLELAQKMM